MTYDDPDIDEIIVMLYDDDGNIIDRLTFDSMFEAERFRSKCGMTCKVLIVCKFSSNDNNPSDPITLIDVFKRLKAD